MNILAAIGQKLRQIRPHAYFTLAMISAFLALSMGSLFSAHPVMAQEDKSGLSISPPLLELSANPGEHLQHSIRVENVTDHPQTITVEAKNFAPLGEEGQAAITDENTNFSLASWMKLGAKEVTLPAKGSQTVTFSIDVPNQAEPGGHFGSVVFRTQLQRTDSGVAVGQEISSLILLKVAGDVHEKVNILDFAPTKKMWQQGPIGFDTRVQNGGNVHVKVAGKVTISNIFGKKVAVANINGYTVLPGSVRKIHADWQGSHWPGWYTANLSLNYGSNSQLITSSASFVIFPYKVIVPIVVVLALLGFAIFRGRERLKRSFKILFGKE